MTSTSNKNEKIIDELTISEDFNLGLSGEQVFPEAAISNKKPSETEWLEYTAAQERILKKSIVLKLWWTARKSNLFLAAIKSLSSE